MTATTTTSKEYERMQREALINGRVFSVDELDGFYVGDGLCVHITFEDAETIAIDVFDDELAAYDGNRGKIIGFPIILSLRTGEARLEKS